MAKVVIHTNKARVTIAIANNWNLGIGLIVRAYLQVRLVNTIIVFIGSVVSLDLDQIDFYSQVLPFKY